MLRKQYSGYEYIEPNGSGIYDQTARPRIVTAHAEGGHSTCLFYYRSAENGGRVEVRPLHSPAR